jgi:hypothetical protein
MAITIKISSDVVSKVRRISSPLVHNTTDDMSRIVIRNLVSNTKSGALIRSVYVRKYVGRGRVYIGTDHWRFIEYGTKAHIIKPRYRKALYWDGALHPVRRVRHPGTRAYAPMRRALHMKRVA